MPVASWRAACVAPETMGASAMAGYAGVTMGGSMIAYGIGTLTGAATPFTKVLVESALPSAAGLSELNKK